MAALSDSKQSAIASASRCFLYTHSNTQHTHTHSRTDVGQGGERGADVAQPRLGRGGERALEAVDDYYAARAELEALVGREIGPTPGADGGSR